MNLNKYIIVDKDRFICAESSTLKGAREMIKSFIETSKVEMIHYDEKDFNIFKKI